MSNTPVFFDDIELLNLGLSLPTVEALREAVNQSSATTTTTFNVEQTEQVALDANAMAGELYSLYWQLKSLVDQLSKRFVSTSTAITTQGNQVIEVTASVTITLNANPKNKESVTIKRNTTAGPVTINGNGNNINDAASYRMLVNFEGLDLIYSSATGVWLTV